MEIQRPEAFVLRVFLHLVSLGLQLHSLLRAPGVRPVAGHASYMEPVGTMWNFLCCVSMRNKSCSSLLGLLGENATDLKKKLRKKRKENNSNTNLNTNLKERKAFLLPHLYLGSSQSRHWQKSSLGPCL